MRIILLIPILYCMVTQAQPILVNLTGGTTGQYLKKSSNADVDYAWATIAGGGDMLKTENLSGLANYTTARSNMGLVIGTNVLAPNGNGSSLTSMTSGQVGLGNVDNTSNATERAASAVLSTKTIATFNYAADAGANDTYVISLSPSPGAYTTGMIIFFKANTVNTGAASINVNGLGAKTIVKRVSTALANGDIPALSLKMIIYDGTNFVLINPVVN